MVKLSQQSEACLKNYNIFVMYEFFHLNANAWEISVILTYKSHLGYT